MTQITPDDKKGRTAREMKAAPEGCTYIVHNMRQLPWFEALRLTIERQDIKFMLATTLGDPKHLAGLTGPIMCDHWCETQLTASQRRGLEYLQSRAVFGATMDRLGK